MAHQPSQSYVFLSIQEHRPEVSAHRFHSVPIETYVYPSESTVLLKTPDSYTQKLY